MISRPQSDKDFPWWLVAVVALGAFAYWQILSDDLYTQVLTTLRRGVLTTVFVTLVGFGLAATLGLGLALAALSRSLILRQIARFYVEIIRGIPIIVLLLYVAFVLAPALVALWNWAAAGLGLDPIRTRDFSLLWRAILALSIGYSAFLAEVFRAGLQSVEIGQIEAAEALGLGRWNRFRHIVFPQAIRTILPPLGNDFVAMVKDSSLVSVLGVLDITQLGKVTAAGNFRYFETYNVVALIYLTMTITLSLALRRFERGLGRRQTET
jgi:polar amino acid transport system permease protein